MNFILLATYNGAAYLPEMLESIRRQTCGDWRLLARDDGSTDDTPQILQRFAQIDTRINVLVDSADRLGAVGNFGRLLEAAARQGATTVSCADQDDVWLPHKLERELEALWQLAAVHGRETPLLVHSDLRIVDAELRPLAASLHRAIRVDPHAADPLAALCVTNFVTGCATIFNRALLNIVAPLPADARMHDWWIALCAAAMGKLGYIEEPTVLYRQHSGNVIGAAGLWSRFNPFAANFRSQWRRGVDNLRKSAAQMRALRARIVETTDDARHPALETVENYCRAFEENRSTWERWQILRQSGYAKSGVLRQALLAARLMSLGRSAA
ncbi:MAG: glycosyltransferase family 2 protein [Pirellulales bacterium]